MIREPRNQLDQLHHLALQYVIEIFWRLNALLSSALIHLYFERILHSVSLISDFVIRMAEPSDWSFLKEEDPIRQPSLDVSNATIKQFNGG